jgi:hypothetical protein
MLAFRRAANILAQEQDRIVFDGFDPGDGTQNFVANRVRPQKGLADRPARLSRFESFRRNATGSAVVAAVVAAIGRLENALNPGPFACVLGNTLFDKAHEPSQSLVLPADRIKPLLKEGPLLRSGKMDPDTGIVVSLAGGAVDIVIGTPPTVQFLQRKENARFLFRVYERFVLRIRDVVKPPVEGFTVKLESAARKSAVGRIRASMERAVRVQELRRDLTAARLELKEAENTLAEKTRERDAESTPAAEHAVKIAEQQSEAVRTIVTQIEEQLKKEQGR